jgi:PadR family transcriptional regulator PadR
MVTKPDLMQGSLELLILKSLDAGPLHGWAVSRRIRERSSDLLQVNQGSLYPALYRLEDRGLVSAKWAITENGREIKLYRLTPKGRREFETSRDQWRDFVGAVEQVLSSA